VRLDRSTRRRRVRPSIFDATHVKQFSGNTIPENVQSCVMQAEYEDAFMDALEDISPEVLRDRPGLD